MNRHPIRWMIQSVLVYAFVLGGFVSVFYSLVYGFSFLWSLIP